MNKSGFLIECLEWIAWLAVIQECPGQRLEVQMNPSWGLSCGWLRSRTVLSGNFNHINIELWLSMHLGELSSLSGPPLFLSLLSFFTQRSSLCIHMRMMSAIKMRKVIMRWTVSQVKITVSSLALSRVLIWSVREVILPRTAGYDIAHHEYYLDAC